MKEKSISHSVVSDTLQFHGQQRNQKGNLKKYLETNENGNTTYQNSWHGAKSSFKNEVHSNKCPPQETINIPNKQHNFTTQETRKRTKFSRGKK